MHESCDIKVKLCALNSKNPKRPNLMGVKSAGYLINWESINIKMEIFTFHFSPIWLSHERTYARCKLFDRANTLWEEKDEIHQFNLMFPERHFGTQMDCCSYWMELVLCPPLIHIKTFQSHYTLLHDMDQGGPHNIVWELYFFGQFIIKFSSYTLTYTNQEMGIWREGLLWAMSFIDGTFGKQKNLIHLQ